LMRAGTGRNGRGPKKRDDEGETTERFALEIVDSLCDEGGGVVEKFQERIAALKSRKFAPAKDKKGRGNVTSISGKNIGKKYLLKKREKGGKKGKGGVVEKKLGKVSWKGTTGRNRCHQASSCRAKEGEKGIRGGQQATRCFSKVNNTYDGGSER